MKEEKEKEIEKTKRAVNLYSGILKKDRQQKRKKGRSK